MMGHGTFATAINCMDGRAQEPVIAYLKRTCHVDYVDMITEAGADACLAAEGGPYLAGIRARAAVSVNKHGSRVIAVVGHADCAGNPVGTADHATHIKRGVEAVRAWGWPVQVVGLWLDESWQVQVIVS
ncbi:MAG: carbonic anhydrase [Anaerolineae bacterium]